MREHVVSLFYPLFLLNNLLLLSLLIIQITEEQSNEDVFVWNDRISCKNEELIEGGGRVVGI
jgi:hypothetical protein